MITTKQHEPLAARFADLDEAISAVLACEDADLGVSGEQAAELNEQIVAADRADTDALRAYDLLRSRALFGRAW